MNKNLSQRLLTAGLTIGLLVLLALTIYLAVTPPVGESFTEFYVLGASKNADNYPTNITLGDNGTVILGVVNHEYQETSYRILITLDNKTLTTLENIILQNKEVFEREYTFTPESIGDNLKLEFFLYKMDSDGIYRHLRLWLKVHPP